MVRTPRSRRAMLAANLEYPMNRLALRGMQLVHFMAPAYAAKILPPFVKYWRAWGVGRVRLLGVDR